MNDECRTRPPLSSFCIIVQFIVSYDYWCGRLGSCRRSHASRAALALSQPRRLWPRAWFRRDQVGLEIVSRDRDWWLVFQPYS